MNAYTQKNFIPQGSISVDRLDLMLSRIEDWKYSSPRSREDLAKAALFVAGNGDDVRRSVKRFVRKTKGFEPTELTKAHWVELQKSLAESLKKPPLAKIGLPEWTLYNSLVGAGATKLIEPKDKWPRAIAYDVRQHGALYARKFLRERPARIIATRDGSFYSFDAGNGIWQPLEESALRAEISATDKAKVIDANALSRVIQSIRDQTYTTANVFEWIKKPDGAPEPRDLMLFRNGILNLQTFILMPHSDNYFATALPSFDYDELAECPTWEYFLGSTLHRSYHDAIHEWLGYVMTSDLLAQKMAVFVGASRGGKSTMIDVVEGLVGRELFESAMLSDLGSEFGLASALGKKVLSFPDAASAPSQKRSIIIERLRAMTGMDRVSVNRKYRDTVSVIMNARLILTCNRHPKFLDESGALVNRYVIFEFQTSFKGKEDVQLGAKLRSELSGIANLAVEGIKRLRENKYQFSIGKRGREAAARASHDQSPALRFAEEVLTVTGDPKDFAARDEIYEHYDMWCTAEGLTRHEIRNRTDLEADLEAALLSRGVKRGMHRPSRAEAAAYLKRTKASAARQWRGLYGVKLK